MKVKIKKIIESLRPSIKMHGGDLEFIDYDEKTKTVKVKLKGSCVGCPMSEVTLRAGILEEIKSELPEVQDIENLS